MMNVSVITDAFRKRMCLNISVVMKPNAAPIRMETTPRIKSYSRISNGVFEVNCFPWRLKIALKIMIDTMSLVTPSPKMHE